jgi:succinoglycan biosynthesis transport protein ExoP
VKRRKLMIILVTFVVATITTGTTIYLYLYHPGYTAEALVNVIPPRLEVSVVDQLADPSKMELPAQTEARRIKRRDLLADVLALPEVRDTRFFRSYGDKFEECLFDLQRKVSTAVLRDTTLIRVAFTGSSRNEAMTIVNAIVDRYLAESGAAKRSAASERVEKMRQYRAQVAEELENKRRELRTFRQQTDVPALETERAAISGVLNDLRKQITENESSVTALETQYETIAGFEAWELPITPEMEIQVNQDPILRFRREQVESLELEKQALLRAGVIGENHRQIALLEERRRAFQEAEAARREELYDQLRAQQIDGLEQSLAQLRAIEIRLREKVADEEARLRDLDRGIQAFQDMESDRDRIATRLAEIEGDIGVAEQLTRDTENLRLVELAQRAEASPRPSWPSLPLFVGGGLVLALASGLGLAFLREFADQAIRTPVDIARHAHMSVLGCIPKLDDEEADVDDIERAALTAPQSLVAESFRQVRTNLMFSGPVDSQRTLLVVSPGPGDGKSSVAINLAVTLARGGASVLLVDVNFRRPALREIFSDSKPEGLSNILVGQRSLEDLVTPTETANLHVLTSGPLPPTPAELLGSAAMRDFLDTALRRYDRVILDGPPVLLMSDALVLSAQVDGVLLVSRAASNTKGELKRAHEQLQRIGARVIGSVLNGIEARPGGYFRRQYREFYDYVSDETVPQDSLPTAGALAERSSAARDDEELPEIASDVPDFGKDLPDDDDQSRKS